MKFFRFALWGLVGAGLVFLLLARHPLPSQVPIGGTFTLTDTKGETVKDSDFRGRLMLVYMGYSHCPDICPATLDTIGHALMLLKDDAPSVAAIFITLDPERDTPGTLGGYLAAFDPRIIGLTGSVAEITAVASGYKVFAAKAPTGQDNYLVNHSGFLFLMDRTGHYVMHFDAGVKPETIAQAVRQQL